MIKLFAGLGNPGANYENTRHNFGFIAIDAIADAKALEFKNFENVAEFSFFETQNGKVFLLKPLTYMNLSGQPLSAFARYYKINPEEIFVFYDDFSIPLGEFRIRMSGSDGGHNGVKSLIQHLNTQNFARMKLGIGPMPPFMKMPDFVLSRFSNEDVGKIKEIAKKAVELFDAVNMDGLEKAISKVSL